AAWSERHGCGHRSAQRAGACGARGRRLAGRAAELASGAGFGRDAGRHRAGHPRAAGVANPWNSVIIFRSQGAHGRPRRASRTDSTSGGSDSMIDRTIPGNRSEASVLATNKVIRNTYILLSLTLAFSAVTAGMSMALGLPHPGIILTLVGYFGLLFLTTKLRNSTGGIFA